MLWEAPGDDEHGVDAHIFAATRVTVGERAGGGRDSAEAVFVEGEGGLVRAGPRLHFDEGDRASAAGDEVDLAQWRADPAGEDRPAFEAEPEGGDALGAAAAPLGPPPVHLSASARS